MFTRGFFKLLILLASVFSTSIAHGQGPVFSIDNVKGACEGFPNGSFEVLISSATGPVEVFYFGPPSGGPLSATIGTPLQITGLTPRLYVVVVQDDIGSTVVNVVIDSYPVALTASIDNVTNNSSCTTPNGSIDISPTGGSGPPNYTFSWTGPNGFSATTEDISDIPGGSYSVLISDNNTNCTELLTPISVTDPSPAVFNITNPSPFVVCNGSDWTLTLDGSEAGATYEVFRNNVIATGITQIGDGSPISLTIPWGTFTNGNNFKVTASNGFCTPIDMNGIVIVDIAPLPTVSAVTGGGIVCAGDPLPDVTFQFTGSAPFNFTYTDGTTNFPIANHPTNTYTIPNAPAGIYQIISLQDNNGCNATALGGSVQVIVNPLATAEAGANAGVCSGDIYVLAGSTIGGSATTGAWNIFSQPPGGDGVLSNTTQTPTPGTVTFTATVPGLYTLRLTTNDPAGPCVAVSDDVIITIEPAATVDAGSPQTICAGGTVTLAGVIGGSAGSSTWTTSGDGIFDDASLASGSIYTPGAADITAGTVTLTLTTDDPAGACPAVSANIVITINALPVANAGVDQSACAGGFITLGGSIGGGATGSIWTTSGDGTFTNVLSPTSNYTPGLADISNGSVTLTLTTNDPAGPCIAVSDDVEITIINGIDASLPVNVTISPLCVGGSTTITVDNSETGVSYQLRNDSDDTNVGTPVIGDGGTISLSTGSLSATTTFNILATLSGCPSAELTNTATVTVTGNINAGLSVAAIDNALCSGASTSIQITNAETGVLYQLRNDADDSSVGSALPGNGGTLDLPTGVLTATTTFNILATNGSCSVELTDLETVTVVNAPDATLPVSVTIDPVCSGGASDVEIQNSQPGITYQLRDDNGDVPVGASAVGNGATLSLPTGPLTVTTTFNVLATAGGTCPAVELTTLVTVNVTGGLDANLALAPVDDPVCSGTATVIQITGSEVGVTYQLRDDNGNVNIGSPIAGNGGLLDLPTGNLSSSTTFNILATNGTCSIELVNLATVNVEIDPNATIPVSATIDPLCVGGVGGIRIDNSQTGVSYQLRNDADDSNVLTAVAGNGGSIILDTDVLNTTTTFNVLATSGTACSPVELNTTVTINVAGTINAGLVTTASPATICAGSSAFVQVEGSESGVSYQLRLDTDDSTIGSPVVSTGGTINLPTGNLTATSQFNVLAGNGTCSIELTDKETITVTPGPNLALNVSANPGLICPGLSSTVIVEGSESGVSYQLRIGNTNVGSPVAGNGGNINLPTGSVTANTTYNVLATQGSCSVQLTSTPTVSLRSAGDPACTGGGGVGCFAYTVLVVDAETMRPSCADQDDGILTMNITGITPGNYIIQLISPTDTLTQVGPSGKYSFINLSAAMYSYKIQDAAGNICQQPYNLPLATVVQATASNPVDAVCFGDASGMVTLDITGGNSPYEYSLDGSSWMPVLAGGTIGNLPSSGTYPILVRDDNTDLCPAEVLVTINSVNPAIQATFDIDPATCDGADGGITITSTTGGGGSGYEYSLNGGTFSSGPFTNLNGGSYTVTVRDNIGCTQDFTVDVTFPGFVAHNVVAENADCDNNGRSGFITLAIADAGVFQVALSTDQFNEPDDMEFNNYNAPSVTYSDLERGTYYVYIKSSGATCATRTAPIVIQGAYAINFDIEPICSGNELSISLTNMTGEPGLPIEIQVYRKFTNVLVDNIQVPAIPATNSYLIDYATHVFLQTPGEYQIQIVQVQSTFCLLSSELIDYDVPLPLFAAIGATTESYPDIENGSMQIINFSGPGPDYMTYIRLDSASVPGQFYEAGPDVVPVNSNNDYEIFYNNIPAGRYEVIVTDKNGCSKELIARVPLDTDIFIPNIFTPNGDGDNDIFFIRNLPENEASIIISNRWGSEVYSSKNYQNNWNAEGVNDGVYYYRLKVPDKEVLTGWIEVLRGAKP